MTPHLRKTAPRAFASRKVCLVLAACAIGLGGWQAAQTAFSGLQRAVDQALWGHALQGSPTVTDLHKALPVWRAREGASGDKILERVDPAQAAQSRIAVINEVSGQTIPSPELAEQAASYTPQDASHVEPARFNGLTAGDRLTITTTDGQVYKFDVVAPDDSTAGDRAAITIQVEASSSDGAPVLHAVPVTPHTSAADLAQQDL